MVVGDPKPMAETNREAAKAAAKEGKTRILHEGRPDVERTIPVLTKNRPSTDRMEDHKNQKA
jgi:hypothetical protein